jgi:hypothetical protein
MAEWVQFAVIIFITTIDDLWHEIVNTWSAIRDVVRYRLRWIVTEKLRSIFSPKP